MFDGIYFGTIKNLASSSQIQDFKEAILQDDNKEIKRLNENLSKEYPQLCAFLFVEKNFIFFIKYLKGDNNALFTLEFDFHLEKWVNNGVFYYHGDNNIDDILSIKNKWVDLTDVRSKNV